MHDELYTPIIETPQEAFRRGRKLKLVVFTIWSVLLITTSLICGQMIGVTAPHDQAEALLKKENQQLLLENKELKAKCQTLWDSLLNKTIASN